jgi:hypothetical protein
MSESTATALSYDELEAARLADVEKFSQAEAAEKMGVSRATFGRIVESARGKIVSAIIRGNSLIIEGGDWCHPTTRDGRMMKKCAKCKRFDKR